MVFNVGSPLPHKLINYATLLRPALFNLQSNRNFSLKCLLCTFSSLSPNIIQSTLWSLDSNDLEILS